MHKQNKEREEIPLIMATLDDGTKCLSTVQYSTVQYENRMNVKV
jgi:hypothetical protein